MSQQFKQSTAGNFPFQMVDSTDSITGKTGLSPTVVISKNAGAFGSPGGSVTEIGNGWYNLALNTTDTNTLGPLALYATAAGADPASPEAGQVFVDISGGTVASVTGNVAGNVAGSVGSVTGAVGSVTGAVGSVTGAVGSVTGNVGGNVVGSVASVVAVVSANLTQILGTALTETAGQIAAGFKKFFNIASPTSTMNEITLVDTATTLTNPVASVTGNVGGNVTGSVGSVLGNVGGNVVGTVASVVGNIGGNVVGTVASVVGNVGGNVIGTVASVVGAVGSVLGNIAGSVASVVGSVGSVTGNVGGNVTGSVASVIAGVTLAPAQVPFKKNVGVNGFSFPMYNTSGALATGLTVTAQRTLDGAALAPCANAVVEIGSGYYKIDFAAGDLNATCISFLFTATGAAPSTFSTVTQ